MSKRSCRVVGLIALCSRARTFGTYSPTRRPCQRSKSNCLFAQRPVVVVGKEQLSIEKGVLGAVLALGALDLLQFPEGKDSSKSPIHPVKVLACHSEGQQDDYRRVLSSFQNNDNDKDDAPILHVLLEGRANVVPLLDGSIRDAISFLGIDLTDTLQNDGRISAEDARECGHLLEEVISNSVVTAAICLDMSLHLSMLQANCLPKSLDVYAIRSDRQEIILVEYLYDLKNHMGGSDPLVCPTKEYRLSSSSTGSCKTAFGAAYTALRGSGIAPLPSACLAAGVGAVVEECTYPPYTWEVLEQIIERYHQVQQSVVQDRVLLPAYLEFGYQ